MKRDRATARESGAGRIRSRVLRAIAANRTAGLHFPGYFLELEWGEITGGSARIAISSGEHCADANGEADVGALAILADTALATTARPGLAPGARLATIHLQMQFTGAPATGRVEADARLLGLSAGSALRQSMSSAVVRANGEPVCHASGEFVVLDPPPGVKLAPLPWQREASAAVESVDARTLEPHERAILEAADDALAAASGSSPFIQHFWGGAPRRTTDGSANRVAVGPHLGNRVGHVQGGILFAIAAHTARAALPAGMMLSNVSAWYISPGRGTTLAVRSRILHAGRTVAVVRTEIKAGGARVLEAVTHHVARRRD